MRVQTTIEGGVAEVMLNRPEKRNGLDVEMFDGIVEAGRALCEDRSVRAVVLHGAGPSFCAGLDFKSFMAGGAALQEKLLGRPEGRPANLAQEVSWVWREVPVPVICAIQGHCFGGGLQIALGADLRYARADAQLSVMEMKWGLIPDMGITATLPALVGNDVAKELTFTARVFDGTEAKALGVVTGLTEDPLAKAREVAAAIAKRSPHAIRAAKQLFDGLHGKDTRARFEFETELQLPLLGSKNQLEAVMAGMQNRDPVFDDVE